MDTERKRLGAWQSHGGLLGLLVERPVAANLITLSLVLLGLISLWSMKREVFPSIELDLIQIEVQVNGASALEIEDGVLLGLESSLRSVRSVKRVAGEARRELGLVRVEFERGTDMNQALQEVKSAVDEVRNFPANAETPIVRLLREDDLVFSVLVFGDGTPLDIHKAAESLRARLVSDAGITRVEHAYERQREITVEVDPLSKESLALSLSEIADRIEESSLDQLNGYLADAQVESTVRTQNRLYTASEYEKVIVKNDQSGGRVLLSEIANVQESFGESRTVSLFDGKPAALLHVYREGEERPATVAEAFTSYMDGYVFPQGIDYRVVDDQTVGFESRIGLLLDNAWMGLILVWVTLSLFLRQRIAFRVMVGIPVCFIGACLPIYYLGGSLNMFSLAAFIITLGIVVDDAIIVGEGIFERQSQGVKGPAAAYQALGELGGPVIAAVLTNIIAFLPLFFLPGFLGKILYQIPVVVVSILSLSLIEAVFILPSHLAKSKSVHSLSVKESRVRRWVTKSLDRFTHGVFRRWLAWSLTHRYLALSGVMVWLLLCFGLMTSGLVRTALTPRLESDTVMALARLEAGSTVAEAERIRAALTQSWERAFERLGIEESEVLGVWSLLSDRDLDDDTNSGGRLAVQVRVFLETSDERALGTEAMAKRWNAAFGEIEGIDFVGFSGTSDVGAEPILVELNHENFEAAMEAANWLKARVETYGITSSIDLGGALEVPSYEVTLNQAGELLGLTTRELSTAMRGALHGIEALRFQDGPEEVRVMVREPLRSVANRSELAQIRVPLSGGGFTTLGEVGRITKSTALEQVLRANGRRVVPVAIELQPDADEDAFAEVLENQLLPQMKESYPKIGYSFQGEQKEDGETFAAMGMGLALASLGIYALLAISLNSYTLPLAIVLVVPLGIGGAILGHLIMGMPFSLVSFVGVLALSGIVVNDALVLVHASQSIAGGDWFEKGDLLQASQKRLRPILLTSFTTFAGLVPMLFETSPQALFLVPLAVSLGFGVLFATVTTLMVVPCLLIVRQDLLRLFGVELGSLELGERAAR